MTAAALTQSTRDTAGLRSVSPARDTKQVAELIELAFAGQLDEAGRRFLRDMRAFGRAGWLGWLLGRLFLPAGSYPQGYVWEEEDGRVVGNASLTPVGGIGRRWVLANVAVHPEFRRRGIARSLVQACLDHVRSRGGRKVVLQVRSGDGHAQALYSSLEFYPTSTRTRYVRSPYESRPDPPGGVPIQRRHPNQWEQHWALAKRVYPDGIIWPYPPAEAIFRPRAFGGILGTDDEYHWVWSQEGRVAAGLTARRSFERGTWRLVLVVEEALRGLVERPLLMQGLSELKGHVGAVLEYPVGLGEDAILSLSFRRDRTLTWMALNL